MASRHHRHCHQPPPIPSPVSTSTTCYCTSSPTPPASLDPQLLQTLISLLQSSSQNPSPNPPCSCDSCPNLDTQHRSLQKFRRFGGQKHVHGSPSQAVLASILNRIEALESSLQRRDSIGSKSVREAAARVIQAHFRAYLVRRSRSLRHLKDLAFIKSRFNALKSQVSDHGRVDLVDVSLRTVDLLHKVDSIQDRDPMIVNGKRSLARDLVGFLDYLDAVIGKRHGVLTRAAKKVSVVQTRGGCEKPRRIVIETRRDQVEEEGIDAEVLSSSEEEIPYVSRHVMNKKSSGVGNSGLGGKQGAQIRGKKNVRFADDGRNKNVISTRETNTKPNAGNSSTGDLKEIIESLRKRVEGMEAGLASGAQDDDEEESEDGASAQTSDGESRGTTSAIETGHKIIHLPPSDDDDDEFSFPATELVKTDTKPELGNSSLKIRS